MSSRPAYSFFPWLRQGLGNQITDTDTAGRVKLRSEIPIALELTGSGLSANLVQQIPLAPRNVPLAGPGDIVGIESRAIVRTEPRDWITNFEPNYVPCIEFYDEDFPWRYTPAKADTATHRLRPWIALVVLEEGTEFKEGANLGDRSLPYIVVDDPARFPPADQLWAWAHVHVNRSMIDTGMRTPALGTAVPAGTNPSHPAVQRLEQTLDENADLAYSRLICPRKLKDNTAYHAFVVPVFETGRLAGLGLDPSKAPEAMQSAWGTYPGAASIPREQGTNYPYYHRWYFRTGTVGDFEYLVRLLKPRTVDKRVGTRDMDVQDPDANLPGIADPALAGVLKLGGALKVPRKALSDPDWAYLQAHENWATPYPRPFQEKLATLINLADDYQVKAAPAANSAAALTPGLAGDQDPLITPPLYGQWHALQRRLLKERDGTNVLNRNNWFHQLNLDPRHRVTAGFGTKVVQQKQEDLMAAAWQQIGAVLEAQRRIRDGQLVKQVSWIWYARHIKPMLTTNPERAFTIAAPVHNRIIAGNLTVAHTIRQSALPAAAMSAPVRRMLRPRARLATALPIAAPGQPQDLLRRLNNKEVSAAPPRIRPPKLVTPGDVAAKLRPPIPGFLMNWLRKLRFLPWVILLLLLITALLLWMLLPSGSTIATAIGGVAAVLFAVLRRWSADLTKADTLDDVVATPADVASMPKLPHFTIAQPGQDPAPATGSSDSLEGTNFKDGLRGARTLIGGSKAAAAGEAAKGPAGASLTFTTIAAAVVTAINPDVTVPLRTLTGIKLPTRLAPMVTEQFREPFAYPQFDMPMYKPLIDISSELFLPNLNLIEQNTIILLEQNFSFIEAYMIGLNHELGRELMWREYPTDQHGSYFRQFWDVRAFLDAQPEADPEAQKEKLRDITKLHQWSRTSSLKDHDNRQSSGAAKNELVLTIRGELLKKYPNAVIYAHRAEWQLKTDGSKDIDPTQERRLVALTAAEEDNPPKSKVRTPQYEAKVDPDIFFFGFDLTDSEVKGGTGEDPGDDPGWFFIIKERPGEPRFGFDIGAADPSKIHVWNDLGWDNVQSGPAGSYVVIDSTMSAFEVKGLTLPDEKKEQHQDDVAIKWNKDMNAADVAYVLYQAPVLVAVHGAEMLRPEGQ
ncbi:hypothetical protein [Nitrospira defluvii]|uniref:Uncharacterized protein n=1 Tax=Nitrospira defluvii TaxID=330214 RepID=A0ABM8S8I1_9BACT|nr:hypothetical protein [Nitrospira defluvii]CAE6794438.1 conserved hypothetical protein [Nitrospira defluvii]